MPAEQSRLVEMKRDEPYSFASEANDSDSPGADPAHAAYLPSRTLAEYLKVVAAVHPALAAMLAFDRPGARQALQHLAATRTEFDSDRTGRGDSYRRAQKDASVRWVGARQLLRLTVPPDAPPTVTVLDVLGGDGTIARAVEEFAGDFGSKIAVVTADLSGEMIDRALAHGLAAVRQSADFLFLDDECVDAVLLAYGTHHIAPADRHSAVTEALRVVRPGGHVVLHDFDESSPMSEFFATVVHPHSVAGHDYVHFSRRALLDLFEAAGSVARVIDIYDPLIVRADSEQAARKKMCEYVGDMYGVHSAFRDTDDDGWRIIEQKFDHTEYRRQRRIEIDFPDAPVIYRCQGQFVAEVPRLAVVAVARRAGDKHE